MKKKVVAFVPIKLNSERLPHKNILKLGNYSLCYYIFDALKRVKYIDEIYVFCSDEDIMKYVPEGIKFLKRDKRLDESEIKGMEIYMDFVKKIHSDIYVLAHTTSPFLKAESIEDGVKKVLTGEFDSSFSAEKIQTFAWYENKPLNYNLDDIPRTQDMKPIFIETSGFFIFEREILANNRRRIGFEPYLKEVTRIEAIDIDTGDDFKLAQSIIKGIEKDKN